jgi:hypothetical protein
LNCPLCDQNDEDDWHALFTCYDSIQARQSAGLDHIITSRLQQHSNAREMIRDICSTEDRNTAGQFALLVWILWRNRNNSVWNNEKETGRSLSVKARQLWNEWYVVQNCQHGAQTAVQQQQQITWQRPSLGWYKCNVVAGFHQDINKTSVGWCLRDHRGLCVAAGTAWNEGNCSILEGEALVGINFNINHIYKTCSN